MLVRTSEWPFLSSFLMLGLLGGLLLGVAYGDKLTCEQSTDRTRAETTAAPENTDTVTLPNGQKVALDELAPGRPAAIVVMKGAWCPVCQRQLKRLSYQMAKVQFEGGAVFGLSTADAAKNRQLVRQLELNFPIVSDVDRDLLERFGLWLDGRGHAMPGVIFLNADGEPVKVHRGRYPGDPQDAMILGALEELAAGSGR